MTTLSLLGGPHALTTVATITLAEKLGTISVAVVGAAVIMLIILVATLVLTERRRPQLKAPLFTLIVLITAATTLSLSGITLTLNLSSPTGGPVKWGADYQVWVCGNQLDLRDPRGLASNRTGSSSLFEQNDGRIHYSGTPTTLPDDASLGAFMKAAGGEISDTTLVFPINDQDGFAGQPASPQEVQPYISTDTNGASVRVVSGQRCGSDEAAVQAFAYTYNSGTKTYSQTKLNHPADYELSHSNSSPPGDCVIVEFGPPKDRTEHLCTSYGARDYDRCTDFGVPADKVVDCDIREVR